MPNQPDPSVETKANKEWKPLKPVTWFLGLEVLAGIRGIILDSIQHDFNLRDWMYADSTPDFSDKEEVWFDFIADIGDGGKSMGSIAYHVQRDIEIVDDDATPDEVHGPISKPRRNGHDVSGRKLERGSFLFIGGDYAYPSSDKRTIDDRVIAPFRATRPSGDTKVPIFGIPANHDYYDDLIGFNRVIRKPIARPPLLDPETNKLVEQKTPTTLDGYVQSQSASYIRIKLPGDWEFWGVDVGSNGIDFRQLKYFRPSKTNPPSSRPRRLIVCTQKPAIVLDHDDTDSAHKNAFSMLALSHDFENLASSAPTKLFDHLECRLDLSGDVHHYSRYGSAKQVPENNNIPVHRYAGIVSGGGGAFLHPTWFDVPAKSDENKAKLGALSEDKETDEAIARKLDDKLCVATFPAHVKYPTPQQCVSVLAPGLLNPWTMLLSGQAWGLAALIALAIFAGSEAWSGIFTAAPHLLIGSATTTITTPWPDIAAAAGFIAAIALPIVWLKVVRPLILGKRSSKRVFRRPRPLFTAKGKWRHWPGKDDFDGDIDSWVTDGSKAPRRDKLEHDPRWALAWVSLQIVVVLALVIAPPWLASCWCPGASMSGVLAILALLAVVAGGFAVGFSVSGADGWKKLPLTILGLILGSMVITLPIVAMLYRSVAGFALVVGLYAVCSLAVTWWSGTGPERAAPSAHRLVTTVLWIVLWPVAILLLAWQAPPVIDQTLTIGTAAGSLVIGLVVCVSQFGWYLYVTYLWGAHNNEAGAAVRCEKYKQWIRFHLKDGVLTGYVIGVDNPVDNPRTQVAAAKIVDVFQVKPGGG